jgi:hypothetical protein
MSESNGAMIESGYIDDGYTWRGYVAGVPRLHPPLRFTFRQCTAQDAAVISGKINRAEDADTEKIASAVIRRQVIEWDLKRKTDKGMEPVPLEVDHINRVQSSLKNTLFKIVMGVFPSDPDPDFPEDDPTDYSASLEAALTGGDADTDRGN